MKRLLILITLLSAFTGLFAQTPETPSATALESSFDFASYTVAAPAGLIAAAPSNNMYNAAIPGKGFSIMALVSKANPKNLERLAENGAKSAGIVKPELKALDLSDGISGYTASARKNNRIVTFALMHQGSTLITLLVLEPESLTPAGPAIVSSLADMPSQRLRKPCRLRLKTLVEPLFANGKSEFAYPLRAVWRTCAANQLTHILPKGSSESIGRVQMLVVIPKRKQKHATDRVLLRRRVREAYRRLLPAFEESVRQYPHIATLSVAFVYISGKAEPYDTIYRKMEKLLTNIAAQLS